jgi:pimeloyl-ACP methyl ester carboxylesterase
VTSLLLIHGAIGAASQLAPLASALEAEHSVHIVELEGHGETPSTNTSFDIGRFAQNVRDAMHGRGLPRAALFGYSMGGYVALHLAAESPDLVTSVMTLGTKLAWTPDVAAREVSRLDPAVIRAKVPRFAKLLEDRHAGVGGWESVLAKTAALMTSLGERPLVDASVFARLAQPVRFIVGDRDTVVSLEETMAAARAAPRGELGVLPNTPHPIEQVSVPLLAAMVRDFLAACMPDA